MAYKQLLTLDEAFRYISITSAINQWVDLFACTRAEAEVQIKTKTDPRMWLRLGAIAKDKGQVASVSMSFRPCAYQEMLILRNGGVWNGANFKLTASDTLNLSKCWVKGNFSVCAKPGTSNHNSGAAADVTNSWFASMTDAQVKAYGLTKNVSGEKWHVVVIELAKLTGFARFDYAKAMGWEFTLAPCQKNYVSGKYANCGLNVAKIQVLLNQKVGANLTIDGSFGTKTQTAVIEFQKRSYLAPTGIVNGLTLAKLAGTPQPKWTLERELYLATPYLSGDDVKNVQNALIRSGANITADGIFGAKSEEATKNFQGANTMPQTGIVNYATCEALGGKWTGTMPEPTPDPDPMPDPEPTPENPPLTRTLKLTSPYIRGGDVLSLQIALNNRIDAKLTKDSIFGPSTDKAVRSFQKEDGLTVNGIVDQVTWDRLWNAQSAPLDKKIIVGTFNIENKATTAAKRKKQKQVIIDAGAHIVGLQETTDARSGEVVPPAPQMGHRYFSKTLSSGYGICTGYNFSSYARGSAPLPGSGEARRLQWVTRKLPDGKLMTYFNTHLHFTDSARPLQIKEVAGLIANFATDFIVLTGDFNVASLAEYKPLTDIGLEYVNKEQTIYTLDGAKVVKVKRIDNIFYSKANITWTGKIWAADAIAAKISDHNALFCELELTL